MQAQQVYDTLLGLSDRFAALLRDKEFVEWMNAAHDAIGKMPQLDATTAQLANHEERLKKAMEREKGLGGQFQTALQENEELKRRVLDLERQVSEMSDHPDIKARRAAELKAQREAIDAELEKLEPKAKKDNVDA